MKTIIAGGRDFHARTAMIHVNKAVEEALEHKSIVPSLVVCGCAEGIDQAGFRHARKTDIAVAFFPAWEFQKSWAVENFRPNEVIHEIDFGGAPSVAHGHIRNRKMADFADALIAAWDGKSKGTKNMIQEAERRCLKVYVYRTDKVTISEDQS